MRASLASATSLLALLLLEAPEVAAAPISTSGAPIPFSYALDSTADAAIETPSPSSAIGTYAFIPVTTASAPTDRAGFDTYLPPPPAYPVTTNPLQGGSETGGASNSVFVGSGGNLPLLDNPLVVPTAASASFGYTIPTPPNAADDTQGATTPADRDDQTTSDTDPQPSTYTPLDHETAASPATPAEADSPAAGASVPNPTPGTRNRPGTGSTSTQTSPGSIETAANSGKRSAGPAAPKAASPTNQEGAHKAFYLTLQRVAREASRGDDGPVAPTGDGYPIDVTSFNVSTVSPDSLETRDTAVPIPIKIVGNGVGELPSSLTIFVDQ